MSLYTVRGLVACRALVAALAVPTESQSLLLLVTGQTTSCPWWGVVRSGRRAGRCRPDACCLCRAVHPCQTCCQPQTCCFAPQTSFRPMVESVPVTTYMPVTSTNPCTGCPVTVMKPVTSFVQQSAHGSVTTFSPVVTAAAPSCSTCGTARRYDAFFARLGGAGCQLLHACRAAWRLRRWAFRRRPRLPRCKALRFRARLRWDARLLPRTIRRTAPTLKAIIPADNSKEKEEPAPQLLDPNNKTAAAMPIQRGRGYIPVGRPARWESEIEDMAPANTPAPTIDEDGWRAASR